ncbi:MAG: outer membrane protein [bacterium]
MARSTSFGAGFSEGSGSGRVGATGATGRLAFLLVLVGVLLAGGARADWKAYVAADFGISTSGVDTDGLFDTGTGTFDLKGMDEDSSPLVGGAIGLEVPMSEILPREWLLDVRLPDWPVRFEVEGAGLREYEFRTIGLGGDAFSSEVEATTFFFNTWLDVPLLSVYRPVQYLFGLGRHPRARLALEPMSLYLGLGIGFSNLEYKGTDNLTRISDDFIEFAWNAGAGINYQVTDRVALAAGYRFIGVEENDPSLGGNGVPPDPNASLEFDQEIHEFRATVRVAVFEFLSPWR